MIERATQQHPLGGWRGLWYRGPRLDVLYEDYARQGRIDTVAPISARAETVVEASVDHVWHVLSRPERWPSFAPDIRDVRLEGDVDEGARFTWRNGRTRLRSRFAVVAPGRELTWVGTARGSNAVHRHLLEPLTDGRTRLISEESMAGPLLVMFFSGDELRATLDTWLAAIAREARSRSPRGATIPSSAVRPTCASA